MDDLKVGPARTQLFRVQATTIKKAIRIALQEEYNQKQAGTPREEEHRHDENGVPQKAEHRSNDVLAPAVTHFVDTGAHGEPTPMDLSQLRAWSATTDASYMNTTSVCVPRQSSESRQTVDPRSGGAGRGQVDQDSPATSRRGMPY
ncbi:hypothetical protein PInf_008755 [Phytophthora infestans]|nr:hypothetical protein PInf_008755 [Phytophthora infestans]